MPGSSWQSTATRHGQDSAALSGISKFLTCLRKKRQDLSFLNQFETQTSAQKGRMQRNQRDMPQRLLSLISNTQNNTHRNISWHTDPKDRPGTALPSRISWKLQPACPEGLGGHRESLVPHTLGRTRVKALELAGSAWLSHGRSVTELTQQDRHQTAPNQHRAQWECGEKGNKPLSNGFAPGSAGQGTVRLLRLPSVTQQPQLSPAPAVPSPASALPLQRHIPQGAGLAAALGAQEEEQLFLPSFFPQGCARALCPAEHPAHCQTWQVPALSPNQPRVGTGSVAGDLPKLSECFLHYREERSKERHFSLPGSHCSHSESFRSREKPQPEFKSTFCSANNTHEGLSATAAIWPSPWIPQKARLHPSARITPQYSKLQPLAQ